MRDIIESIHDFALWLIIVALGWLLVPVFIVREIFRK